jgi:hypothetical protein
MRKHTPAEATLTFKEPRGVAGDDVDSRLIGGNLAARNAKRQLAGATRDLVTG